MADWPRMREMVTIGYVDATRSVRSLFDDRLRAIVLTLTPFVPGGILVALALVFDRTVRSLSAPVPLPRPLLGSVGFLWTFATFVFVQRTATRRSKPVNPAFVLTNVSHRTATAGLLFGELLGAFTFVFPTTVALTFLSLHWFGFTPALVVLPLAVCLFLASAITVGAAIGYLLLVLTTRVSFVARNRTEIGGIAVVSGYVLFSLLGSDGLFSVETFSLLPASMLVHLVFVRTGLATDVLAGTLGFVLSTALVAASFRVAELTTARLWYQSDIDATPARADASSDSGEDDREGPTANDWPGFVPLPSAVHHVAVTTVQRARRVPATVAPFALTVVFVVGLCWYTLPLRSVAVSAVVWPWFTGGLFTLNVVGDEGNVLPFTTLSRTTGVEFVVGRCLPGVTAGTAGVVSLVTGLSVVTPGTWTTTIGTISIGVVTAVSAPFVAVGVGTAFPRARSSPVARGDPAPPNTLAIVAYSFVVLTTVGLSVTSFRTPAVTRDAVALLPWLAIGSVGLMPMVDPPGWLRATCEQLATTIERTPVSTVATSWTLGSLLVLLLVALVAAVYVSRRIDSYCVS